MTSNIRKSPLVAAALAAVALTATIPSVASAREEVVKAKVFHGDLDLATEAGVKALDRRLRSAIWQLCGSPGWSMGGVPPATVRCRQMARASITPQRRIAIARATDERVGAFALARNTANGQLVVTLVQ